MTALRWTRRTLDAFLLVAVFAVAVTAGITLLAPVLGGRALVIGGGSMEPTISRGALVLALPAPSDGYAVGDVVTVQQGASTPYTHRIVRLTQLDGVPYAETKGDANAQPDPAIVPTAAIIGTIAVSLPVLGYLSLVLGTAMGLAGFLALCATMLLLIWVLEDLEDQRCAACAIAAGAAHGGPADARRRARRPAGGLPRGPARVRGRGSAAARPRERTGTGPQDARRPGGGPPEPAAPSAGDGTSRRRLRG